MAYCPRCGRLVEENALFCPTCGAPIRQTPPETSGYSPSGRRMSGRGDNRPRIWQVIKIFQQRGATSPEKAMTAEEMGLPSWFETAMHRRLGQTGIFVEVDGKYYLSEEQLKSLGGHRQGVLRGGFLMLRLLRLILFALFASLVLVNLFIYSYEIRIISSIFLVILLALSILQILYMMRRRNR